MATGSGMTLRPCVNCGSAEGLPATCHGWRKRSHDHARTVYEGLTTYNVGVCVRCLHRHYRVTFIAAGCLSVAFLLCLIYRLAFVGSIGTGGFMLLFAVGLPAIIFGARAMNENPDKAAAAFLRSQIASDGMNVFPGPFRSLHDPTTWTA